MTTPAGEDHQDWCAWARHTLDHAAPPGWRSHWNIGVRIGEDLFVPDLVTLSPDTPRANAGYNKVVPALVVEVESRSTSRLTTYRLTDEGYGEALVLGPGDTAELDYPYPVTVTVPSH